VIPIVCFIKGDAKSGDALCCQFGEKNCKGRGSALTVFNADEGFG
jgi:hypothetical protein